MDWVTLRSRGKELVRKYRYVLLVVLAGLFLMALPDGKNTKAAPEPAAAETETTASAADKSFSAWMNRFFFFRIRAQPKTANASFPAAVSTNSHTANCGAG